MLIVFGAISMDFTLHTTPQDSENDIVIAPAYTHEPGGRAANQALAACRIGAKTALVGMIGEDQFGTYILDKLRREGVTTSGVGKSKDHPTGLTFEEMDEDGNLRITSAPAANTESSAEQVPIEVLSDKAVVLIQTDLPSKENLELLEKAKKVNSTTILHLAPNLSLSQKILNKLDYLIVNNREALKLSQSLGMETEGSLVKIAQALAHAGDISCIITLGAHGSIGVDPKGKTWKIGALKPDEVVDLKGAEDVYTGTFAACIYTGMPFPLALKHASIAATLTCTKEGGELSFPYLGDIEEKLDELGDAEELELEIFKE